MRGGLREGCINLFELSCISFGERYRKLSTFVLAVLII